MSTEADRVEEWDARYSANDPHVTADGVELYYELRGVPDGPSLTIVSNFFVVSVAWRPFTTELVKRHHLLTYDLRNQGASSTATGSLRDHTADLRSLLDALEVDQTYLLGHSISTKVCYEFARACPDRVKGLVLVAPSLSPWGAKRRRLLLRGWLRALDREGPEALYELFFPLVFSERMLDAVGTPAYLALKERFLAVNSKEQLRRNVAGALQAEQSADDMPGLPCPTLLVTGEEDFLNTPASLERLAEKLGSASVELMSDAGHTPYFEDPVGFQALVAQFIETVERSQ